VLDRVESPGWITDLLGAESCPHRPSLETVPGMRAIELCAGAGGLTLGLTRAGFSVVGVERNPVAAEVHRRNVGPCETADIREYHPACSVPFVCAGLPCQSFSSAGKQDGVEDERGGLYRELARIAVEAGARCMVMENVRNLLRSNGGRDFEVITQEFRDRGFHVAHRLLDAADYGAAQHRVRLFIVCFADADDAAAFRWPVPTHAEPGNVLGLPARRTVRDALGLRGQYAKPERLAHAQSSKNGKERGWWQGGRAIDVDAPGYTVGTRDNADLLVPLDAVAREEVERLYARSGAKRNPKGYRLKVPELALIQGFPADFQFAGTGEERNLQVGNAVCPVVGEAMGHAVMLALRVAAREMCG
jgi:DNA (cytosine-5)-methyltransferase 1